MIEWCNVRVVGVCDAVPSVTGMDVFPVISYGGELDLKGEEGRDGRSLERVVNDVVGVRFNETRDRGEVDDIFLTSIETLVSTKGSRELRRKGVKLPFVSPTFQAECCDTQIWGLTAIMIEGMLRKCFGIKL